MLWTKKTPNASETYSLRSLGISVRLKRLTYVITVDALEKDVEDAVSRNRQLVFVQEVVLNSFLVVFVAVEVVLLEVIKEPRCDCTDALDVHLC